MGVIKLMILDSVGEPLLQVYNNIISGLPLMDL